MGNETKRRNRNETKRKTTETKRNETEKNGNETKRNTAETKRNGIGTNAGNGKLQKYSGNEMNRNHRNRNETKRNETTLNVEFLNPMQVVNGMQLKVPFLLGERVSACGGALFDSSL